MISYFVLVLAGRWRHAGAHGEDAGARSGGRQGARESVIGMAHRGRLNMLINVLGKRSQELFDEFAGKHGSSWGTGDVKYHMGFSSDFATEGGNVHLALAFNPSHLEIVNPVVVGSVRARQDRLGDELGELVLPITIHGDSANTGNETNYIDNAEYDSEVKIYSVMLQEPSYTLARIYNPEGYVTTVTNCFQ